MLDYFVSHASQDRAEASALVAALEGIGATCFIDHRDIPPGHPRYRDQLMAAIADSECIIVLLSDSAQASDEVDREVQAAHDRKLRRLPVWLGERRGYWNATLEMLLASSQDIVWAGDSAADVAQRVRAIATVSALRAKLAEYQSVVDRLEIDLSDVFARVDNHDLSGAVVVGRSIAVSILRQLWRKYALPSPMPDELYDLVLGCRDHFEQHSLVASFAVINDVTRRAAIRPPTMDMATGVPLKKWTRLA